MCLCDMHMCTIACNKITNHFNKTYEIFVQVTFYYLQITINMTNKYNIK